MRLATALMVVLVVASGIAVWQLREGNIADTVNDNHRLGVVLAEETARSLQAPDFVLQEIAARVSASGVDGPTALHEILGGTEFHEALTQRLSDLPQIEAFAILDATGHFVTASRPWPLPGYTLAERDYFRHFATTPDPNPYISEPVVGRSSGVPMVSLARRLTAPNGAFLGVAIASIRLAYFSQFYAKTGLSDGTGVTILRNDGKVLVRFPAGTVPAGAQMPRQGRWYETVAQGGGNYRSPGAFASVGPSFVSVHPLATYPVVVDVTRSEEAALSRWWIQALSIGLGVVWVAVLVTVLLRALGRQIMLLEESQALLKTTLDHTNLGLMMVDAAGNVAVCNPRAMELLDLPAEMMASNPRLGDVIALQTERGEYAVTQDRPIDAALVLSNQASYERRRPNGTVVEIRTTPLADGGMVRSFTDVTARATAEVMLSLAASHDQLTGLANRNGFDIRLEAALSDAQRGNTSLAVLCLDLDRFKAVNDTFGHGVGDQLLIQVAQRIRDIARSLDVMGRLGGDEFAIVLPGSSGVGAEQVSRRLLETIREPYFLSGQAVHIGVSIGIAIYPTDGGTSEQLLRNADSALYDAKEAGRNTWRAFASDDGKMQQQRAEFEEEFRAAVESHQFELAYQPICDGLTREPVAFEALLRWTSARLGSVSPAEFIPLAERTGLIIPLGRWVIEVACAEAAAWAMPLHIAVNLSPAQFRDKNLLSFIRDVLDRTGLSPSRLDLEVTEGLLLEDVEEVVRTMQALRVLGIRIVLDDFGTAQTNLSYLRGFPFDAVKIDRSFLRALNSDRQARALVEAMLAMARALGLDVVGEGVETQEQLALLCHLQCRWVQGYLLGRPALNTETRDWIWKLATKNAQNDKPARLAAGE